MEFNVHKVSFLLNKNFVSLLYNKNLFDSLECLNFIKKKMFTKGCSLILKIFNVNRIKYYFHVQFKEFFFKIQISYTITICKFAKINSYSSCYDVKNVSKYL